MTESPGTRDYELPTAVPFENHGKTVASWTLTWVVTAGAALIAVGMIAQWMWLVIAGVVVVVVGVVASAVMRAMGMGQTTTPEEAARLEERGRDWYSD